jgi:hypothetical protein
MDQGGVQKEFFQVLLSRLLDPAYGMFTFMTETNTYWFNVQSFESSQHFKVVGIVLGLAMYNGVNLGVHFPKLLWKTLLDEDVDLEDVKEGFPV